MSSEIVISDGEQPAARKSGRRPFNPIAALFLAVAGLLYSGNAPLRAQTLDQALVDVLSNTCAGLTGGLGPNLTFFCAVPVGGDASAGGGTGATQSAEEGFERIKERLKKKRGGEDKGTSAETDLGGGLNLFVNLDAERKIKDITTFEDGFESDVFGGSLGVDYAVGKNLIAGAALNYNREGADFDVGGGFDYDTYGIVAFLSVLPAESVYIDILTGYSRRDYSTSRFVQMSDFGQTLSGLTSGGTEGNIYTASATAGYDYNIGRYVIGFTGGLNYSRTTISAFTEQGSTGLELVYREQTITSLQSVLGAQASTSLSREFGILIPKVGFDYIHEFKDDQRALTVNLVEDLAATPTDIVFQEEAPDRDFFKLSAGVSAVLPNGMQAFANFSTILGHEYLESYAGTLGVRFEL